MLHQQKKRRIIEVNPRPQTLEIRVDECSAPLELSPAIRSMVGYGKRMRALGALDAVRLAEEILEGLTSYTGVAPELVHYISSSRLALASARNTAMKAAGSEEEDD